MHSCMQQPRRYPFMRRMLFPYSGEEALTFKQSLRVLFAWMILVPLVMSCCSLVLTLLFAYALPRIATFFLFTFLSGFCIFGGLGVLVIIVNNQSARIRQARKATRASDTSGDFYGSER
jgi:hypothetical protein